MHYSEMLESPEAQRLGETIRNKPLLSVFFSREQQTKYLLFDSWQHMVDFMLDDSTPVAAGNTFGSSGSMVETVLADTFSFSCIR